MEGGAIICPDERTKTHIDHLKNFGFVGETTVVASGINGKMNEMQAALGLLQLKHIDHALQRRAKIDRQYRMALADVPGIQCVPRGTQQADNHAYFPIRVLAGYPLSREQLYERLREKGILARRYFFPLIADFPMYRGLASAAPEQLPVARQVSQEILCLPIFPELTENEIARITSIIGHIAYRSSNAKE
jgi:dTDP-4-amino-4,6-dideoxygalactose transaminase